MERSGRGDGVGWHVFQNCKTLKPKKMLYSLLKIAYGSTESSPVVTQTLRTAPIEMRVSTVGKASAHTEASLNVILTFRSPFSYI